MYHCFYVVAFWAQARRAANRICRYCHRAQPQVSWHKGYGISGSRRAASYVFVLKQIDNMSRLIALFIVSFSMLPVMAQDTILHEVLFRTDKGDIRIALYNETPRHRDNFMRQVRDGVYDGMLFHRVIADFMIQTGDTASRHAVKGQFLGESAEPFTIPAEISFPRLFHKRGAVGAAREGDLENPERESSMLQFYIVYGMRFNDAMLDRSQQRLDVATEGKVKLTQDIRDTYKSIGGTPHLDGQYTVFGEVVDGLDVVEAIQGVETDGNDRPLEDVRILNATVVR